MFKLLDLYRQKDGLDEEFLLSANYNEIIDITAGARAPVRVPASVASGTLIVSQAGELFQRRSFYL
jgi:hypothetical protein